MSNDVPAKCSIASRLRLAREQAGLSQGQVAKMLGLHRPSLSEVEAGRRNVTADELAKLADIYSMDISWLACQDAKLVDPNQDRILLAAREMAKLKPNDLERVVSLLKALRIKSGPKS